MESLVYGDTAATTTAPATASVGSGSGFTEFRGFGEIGRDGVFFEDGLIVELGDLLRLQTQRIKLPVLHHGILDVLGPLSRLGSHLVTRRPLQLLPCRFWQFFHDIHEIVTLVVAEDEANA